MQISGFGNSMNQGFSNPLFQ